MERRFTVRLNDNRNALYTSTHRSPWSAWERAVRILNGHKYPGVPGKLDFRRHSLVIVVTMAADAARNLLGGPGVRVYQVNDFRAQFCMGHDRHAWKREREG